MDVNSAGESTFALKILHKAKEALSNKEEEYSFRIFMDGAISCFISPEDMDTITQAGVRYAKKLGEYAE